MHYPIRVVKALINQLLESKVIRESRSPYASPIVLVRKKDRSLHLCVDYRLLNSKTRKDAFPFATYRRELGCTLWGLLVFYN